MIAEEFYQIAKEINPTYSYAFRSLAPVRHALKVMTGEDA